MNVIKIMSGALAVTLFAGCASLDGAKGPQGPRLTGGGYSNEYETYAEVGIKFSSVGDFVALVSPTRWKSPLETGGALSWVNPVAWSDDPGRTSRVLIGEVVVVGGVVVAAAAGGGGGGGDAAPASGGTTIPSGPGGSAPGTPPQTPSIP